MADVFIAVREQDFDLSEQVDLLKANASVGAVVSFVGTVRDVNQNQAITELTLEHYPGMTEKSIAKIVDQACERWPLEGVRVIHRVGTLKLTDQIVLVATSSAHRQAAFDSCNFIMDYLKTEAPFWKKEKTEQGEHWVESRGSDSEALVKWD